MAETEKLEFIDLFAGIGGIRIAFQNSGCKCVMTSEWDRWARKTYSAFFEEDESMIKGDITKVPMDEIPRHDILTGGFPCQPFSIAGVSKKNSLGRTHGFEDPTQGTLFFNIKSILKEKQPKAFLLENVKNLRNHDKGKTWEVIQKSLTEVGYQFTSRVIDASGVVPQHRERIFVVGFHESFCGLEPGCRYNWDKFWTLVNNNLDLEKAKQKERYDVSENEKWPLVGRILEDTEAVDGKYVLSEKLWDFLQAYKEKHQKKGNGFGYGMVGSDSEYTRTISARYHKDGSEALVSRGDGENPRRLTPLECLRLQGFPEEFEKFYDKRETQPVSDTQAYRQFGNSVAVPVVSAIAAAMTEAIRTDSFFESFQKSIDTTGSQIELFKSRELEEAAIG